MLTWGHSSEDGRCILAGFGPFVVPVNPWERHNTDCAITHGPYMWSKNSYPVAVQSTAAPGLTLASQRFVFPVTWPTITRSPRLITDRYRLPCSRSTNEKASFPANQEHGFPVTSKAQWNREHLVIDNFQVKRPLGFFLRIQDQFWLVTKYCEWNNCKAIFMILSHDM